MAGVGNGSGLGERGAMNGQEYKQLFELVMESRDASRAALDATKEHGERLGVLEGKVDANVTAVAVGRFGARALTILGSFLIAAGGLIFGLWDNIGGNGGRD